MPLNLLNRQSSLAYCANSMHDTIKGDEVNTQKFMYNKRLLIAVVFGMLNVKEDLLQRKMIYQRAAKRAYTGGKGKCIVRRHSRSLFVYKHSGNGYA